MKTKNLMGFIKDENKSQLTRVFSDKIRFKEVYIDIYSFNPLISSAHPMLLLRTSEENVSVSYDGVNFAIMKSDKYRTNILNILFDSIKESYYKENCKSSFDFILNCQNTYYKLTIFN